MEIPRVETAMNVNINFNNHNPMYGTGGAGQMGSMQAAIMMMSAIMGAFMSQMMGGHQGGGMLGGYPGFGGGGTPGLGGGGLPGGSGFLGASAPGGGGGGASGAASAGAAVDPSSIQGTGWGAKLAKDAAANANGPGGYCFKWVSNALRRHGVNTSGASAYMAADQLAKNPKFREVKVNPQDLKKLPAGAVVVWNKGKGHPHGHISIALGNGKEASDKIRNQITNYGTGVRVFLPK
jgi:hypothetical protein